MKNLCRSAMMSLGLLFSLRAAHAVEKVVWVKSLPSAMTQAKQANKLVMVDFYTDWCGWCKELDKTTYSDAAVGKATQQVVAVKVNAEKEGLAAAKKYQVRSFPTILFVAPDGSLAGRIGGYAPPEPFLAALNKILTTHRELPALEAQARSDSAAPKLLAKLFITYVNRENSGKAEAMLSRLERADPTQKHLNLAKACNAVGEMYRTSGQFAKALPLYQKSIQRGKSSYDIAFAHVSSAICRFATGKQKTAVPHLKTVLAMKNAPAEMKQIAQEMLNVANR